MKVDVNGVEILERLSENLKKLSESNIQVPLTELFSNEFSFE